jgi:electron transfer flavoprotein beta subunit
LRILTFVKQVPEMPDVRYDPATGQLDFKNTPAIISPFDLYAVEEAIATKEKLGGEVTVLSMGPERVREVLKEALAMGCDKAVHLWDNAMEGSDAWATAKILNAAAANLGGYDVAFFGRQAVDGETAAVGAMFARLSGARFAACCSNVTFADNTVKVGRSMEAGKELVEMELPAVISMVKDANKPRYASLLGLRKAAKAEIPTWGLSDLGLEASAVGIGSSRVKVTELVAPQERTAGEIIVVEDPEAGAAKLIEILTNLGR